MKHLYIKRITLIFILLYHNNLEININNNYDINNYHLHPVTINNELTPGMMK